MSNHYPVKQVILMRTDLRNTQGQKVRSGKLMAQASHASMMWLGKRFRQAREEGFVTADGERHMVKLSKSEESWLVGGDFAKIVLAVGSLEELAVVIEAARVQEALKTDSEHIAVEVCVDNGATEFGGVKTVTCAAIGPGRSEYIDRITGHLKTL